MFAAAPGASLPEFRPNAWAPPTQTRLEHRAPA